jgi:hypothetical protein
VKRLLAGVGLAAALALGLPGGGFADVVEQQVTPLGNGEQRVDVLTPSSEQRVETVDAETAQQTVNGHEPSSPAKRTLDTITKAAVGIFAAAVAVGVTVASLLFI